MKNQFIHCNRAGAPLEFLSGVISAIRLQVTDSDDNYGDATVDKLTIKLVGELPVGDRILWHGDDDKWFEWVCKTSDTSRTDQSPITTAKCIAAFEYDLQAKWIERVEAGKLSATDKLKAILKNTAWSVGTVENTPTIDLMGSDDRDYTVYYKTNAATCLHRICKYHSLEAYPEIFVTVKETSDTVRTLIARRINLVQHRGSKTPTWRFDYGRDLESVRRTTSPDKVYTKLHFFGKGDPIMNELNVFTGRYDKKITFEKINGGKDYLEDTSLIRNFGTPTGDGKLVHTEGRMDFSQVKDPKTLLKYARIEFEKQKIPKMTYELGVTALSKIGSGEGPCFIGDQIQVVDTSFPVPLRLEGRIIQVEEDLLDSALTTNITIGTSVQSYTNTYSTTVSKVQSSIINNSNIVNDMIDSQESSTGSLSANITDVVSRFAAIEKTVRQLVPSLLYDNYDTSPTATITLSDNLSNYSEIEVYFKTNDGDDGGSVKVLSPNGKTFLCATTRVSPAKSGSSVTWRMYTKVRLFTAQGNTIDTVVDSSTNKPFAGEGVIIDKAASAKQYYSIIITKVVGYKIPAE